MFNKNWKLVVAVCTSQMVMVAAGAKEHPPNVLHITNVSKERIDFEVKDAGASWDASSYVVQSYFPMGNGVSAFFPLKKEQTADTMYWVRYKKPGESWSAPKKMKEVDGSLNLPQ